MNPCPWKTKNRGNLSLTFSPLDEPTGFSRWLFSSFSIFQRLRPAATIATTVSAVTLCEVAQLLR